MADQTPKASRGTWTRGGSSSTRGAGGATERGRGRGRGTRGRGTGRGGAGARGRVRSANLSWRAPAVAQPASEGLEASQQPANGETMGMEEGGEGEGEGELLEEEEEEEETEPPVMPAFGGAPSAFGTPAFIGGSARTDSPFSAFGATTTTNPFASASTFETPPSPPKPRNPDQISTLEVLGEDSDSRKKRFESTLANNRYLELKPLREAQRVRDIQAGLIPDPLKPMRLDEATNFLGTCEEMCPEWEREEREYQNNVDLLERYPGTSRIDPARAVKAFHRPAAGNDQPLPSDVRPPHILSKTLDYLFHDLLPTQPLHATHPFLRDRTRSVRQDFTMQNQRGTVTIECNERIARYHILALGTLREQVSFSESQELEQLRKVLTSLNEFYDDARLSNPPIPCPNEAEFRSYNILTHLRDPDVIWAAELLPPDVFFHPLLQTAFDLHALAQRADRKRGERASPNAFSRFFKLLESTRVPYLFGCILSTHFNEIRVNALEAIKKSYVQGGGLHRVEKLVKVLGCDDEEEVLAICENLDIPVSQDEEGNNVVELHNKLNSKGGTIKSRVSQRIVEGKRGTTSFQKVIDRAKYLSEAVASAPLAPTPVVPIRHDLPAPQATRPMFGFPTSTSTFPSPAITPPPSLHKTATLNPTAASFAPPFSFAPSTPTAASPATSPAPPPTLFAPPAPDPEIARKREAEIALQKEKEKARLAQAEREAREREAAAKAKAQESARQLREAQERKRIAEEERRREEEATRLRLEKERQDRENLQRSQRRARVLMVDALTTRLTDLVVHDVVVLATRSMAAEASREERTRQAAWSSWISATASSIIRREEEEQKARDFNSLVSQIDAGPVWHSSSSSEGDDDDLNGLDVSSLSLQVDKEVVTNPRQVDAEIATRLLAAQDRRQSLWAPGTFFEIVAEHVDMAFRLQHPSRRRKWSAFIATPDRSAPFASWLACKFDLDAAGLAIIDTPSVDVEIRLLGEQEETVEELDNVGLVILDLSSPILLQDDTSKTHLTRLLDQVTVSSAYDVSLLAFASSDSNGEGSPSQEWEKLKLDLLPAGKSALLVAKLHDDEEQLEACLRDILPQIVPRPDRERVSLSKVLLPLLSEWRAAVRRSLERAHETSAEDALPIFVESLNQLVDAMEDLVLPPRLDKLRFPTPTKRKSLRETIQSYIALPTVARGASFTLVYESLEARPLPSDMELLLLVLDELAEIVKVDAADLFSRRGHLADKLPGAQSKSKTTMQALEERLAERVRPVPDASTQKKKRKASVSPADQGLHKKQAWSSENNLRAGKDKDKLSELSQLIKDATGLLKPRTM